MHLAVRRYKIKSGSVDEILPLVNEGYLPLITQAPGFLAQYYVDEGNGELFTVSLFEDQATEEASTQLAANWVKQNLAAVAEGPLETRVGEVKLYKAK